MVLLADDEGRAALLLRLRHQALDAPDIGTCGVHDRRAGGLQLLVNLLFLAVGTDDHRIPRLHLRGVVHLPRTQCGQSLHHVGVVDDAAQHDAAALVPGRLLRQLHGALHAVAEAGGFRQYHTHVTPPSA